MNGLKRYENIPVKYSCTWEEVKFMINRLLDTQNALKQAILGEIDFKGRFEEKFDPYQRNNTYLGALTTHKETGALVNYFCANDSRYAGFRICGFRLDDTDQTLKFDGEFFPWCGIEELYTTNPDKIVFELRWIKVQGSYGINHVQFISIDAGHPDPVEEWLEEENFDE